jgi:hypothetical protein
VSLKTYVASGTSKRVAVHLLLGANANFAMRLAQA